MALVCVLSIGVFGGWGGALGAESMNNFVPQTVFIFG